MIKMEEKQLVLHPVYLDEDFEKLRKEQNIEYLLKIERIK